MVPKKLRAGDRVVIVAPSRSLGIISAECREIADRRLKDTGFDLSFAEHVSEMDEFSPSSIESRIEDLHAAFRDPEIKGIFAVIGGFNANQLLRYIDWDLIRANPKVFCGYSDTTVLQNAIYTKTGLVTYSAPVYSSFGQKLYFDYTLDYFKKCCISDAPYAIELSPSWSDDAWYAKQDDRRLIANPGWAAINEGEAEGTILGANLRTFNLLQGTDYFPDLNNSVPFLEDDHISDVDVYEFDRNMQSLVHQPGFDDVKGLVIGRFQNGSKMSEKLLGKIITTKKELAGMPVISGVDFGHTDPKVSFPIGGMVKIVARKAGSRIDILKH